MSLSKQQLSEMQESFATSQRVVEDCKEMLRAMASLGRLAHSNYEDTDETETESWGRESL